MPLCWSRKGKSTPSSPQIPPFHHQSSPPSAASVGGSHRGPGGSVPNSIQTRLNAPSIPRRIPHPQSTHPPPQIPSDQHGAPSGTLSTPRASLGPSPDPALSPQGSPVLMNAAGSQLQDSGARAWHGRARAALAPAPAGRRGATLCLHLRPGGEGRGRGKAAAVCRARGGRTSRREWGQRGLGAAGTPRGGWQGVKERLRALVGAPGSAPAAAPRSSCAPGLASPRKQK